MATPEVTAPVPDQDQDRRDPSGAVGRNLEAFLLFELLSSPSYGYNLLQRLKEYGFGRRLTQAWDRRNHSSSQWCWTDQ